jgi:hypothetical protein
LWMLEKHDGIEKSNDEAGREEKKKGKRKI